MMRTKTTLTRMALIYFQILSWNLKTSFYPLLFLNLLDQLLSPLKMTLFSSHLHILFDPTRLQFHPPKTGFLSQAS
jgi:hypothetical protein